MSRKTAVIAGALSLAISGALHAQSQQLTATQTVSYEVKAITQIALTAGTPSLVINTAVAGQPLTQATASSSYSITTNEASSKITAEINTDMPSGLTLQTTLTAPGTGTSGGAKTLSSSPVDVVTGITPVVGSAVAIAYTLDAAVTAGPIAAANKTVTYTVVVAP